MNMNVAVDRDNQSRQNETTKANGIRIELMILFMVDFLMMFDQAYSHSIKRYL